MIHLSVLKRLIEDHYEIEVATSVTFSYYLVAVKTRNSSLIVSSYQMLSLLNKPFFICIK